LKRSHLFLSGLAAALLALFSLTACDLLGPSGPSGPGSFQFELLSPNGIEGAAVFEIAGGVDLGPATVQGADVFTEYGVGTARIVVVLDDPGVIRFQLRTGNVRKEPRATVLQVADDHDDLRPSLTGYEVRMTRVEDGGSP
jgi:hypothetical protein